MEFRPREYLRTAMTMMHVKDVYDPSRSINLSTELRSVAGPALRTVLDYGVDAFVRCWNDAARSDDDLGPLLQHHVVLEHLDACAVLAAEGCAAALTSPLRAMFDALLSISYLAEDSTGRRSRAFVVGDLQSRLSFLRSLDPSTERGKQSAKNRQSDRIGRLIQDDDFFRDRSHEIRTLEQYLNASAFSEEKHEWERTKALLNGRTPRWHNLFGGPKTREELARAVGMSFQYESMYRSLSRVGHGEDLYRVIYLFHEHDQRPVPIRDLGRFANWSAMGVFLAVGAHEAILKRYRPSEVDTNFARWYNDRVSPQVRRLNELSQTTMGKRSW
jgi:hypothetical protein